MLMHIANFKIENAKFMMTKRDKYEIFDTDTVHTKLFMTILSAISTCYSPLYQISSLLVQLSQSILVISAARTRYAEYNKKIVEFYKNKTYHNLVMMFISQFINHTQDGYLPNDIIHDVNEILNRQIMDFKDHSIPTNFLKYIIDVISGKSGANKHVRCDTFKVAAFINEKIDTKNKNIYSNNSNDIFVAVIKFLLEVNFFEWSKPLPAFDMFCNAISILKKYCNTTDLDCNIFYAFMHKIASQMNTFLSEIDNINSTIQRISPMTSYKKSSLQTQYKPQIMSYIRLFGKCFSLFKKLDNSAITDLPSETLLPLSTFVTALLKMLSSGKNAIYSIFNLATESGKLLSRSMIFINNFCQNNNFLSVMQENADIIKEMLPRIIVEPHIRENIMQYIAHSETLQIDEDLPDEFIDPILAIEIKNPVMIPKINQIFDKTSIMAQLYTEQINPFTREPLTIQEFNEYNTLPDVQEQIRLFNKRLQEYRQSKLCNDSELVVQDVLDEVD